MKGDNARLHHIAEAIADIEAFTAEIFLDNFIASKPIQAAVERKFEIIGEASSMLSIEFRGRYAHIEWWKVKAMRNFVAHEYHKITPKIMWDTIHINLPLLKQEILAIIDQRSHE